MPWKEEASQQGRGQPTSGRRFGENRDVSKLPVKTPPSPQTRLSVLLARESDIAVIFRRGPTRQVLLIRWHRADDTFEIGQWFRGRIYENRCDLSPDGERLLYFAAKFINPNHATSAIDSELVEPFYSWTAISRPPFLTALALWPKDDCWGGGGEFVARNHIRLNHREENRGLAEGYSLPKEMTVEPYGEHSGRGEDDPVHSDRLARDGWRLVQEGEWQDQGLRAALYWVASPAFVFAKANPAVPTLMLTSSLHGIGQRGGPWRVLTHAVESDGQPAIDLGPSEWADWDRNGDLLFARDGQLYRCVRDGGGLGEPRVLLDARELRFRALAPTPEAMTWDDAVAVVNEGAEPSLR
jgi:hypothetical protein